MEIDDVREKIREKPLTVTAVIFVLLFWMLTPLLVQKYLNYSAINVSFAITVFYFVAWKIYRYLD
jgi:hypothetical protein